MRNYCSCPPNLTFMPQISAWIPVRCGEVGQGAPPVIPDFSLWYENSPACLGSSESFLPLPSPCLLSCPWSSVGSAGWGLASMQHHQRATIKQLFWQGRMSSPQTLANPTAKIRDKRGSASMQDGLCRAGTEFPLSRSHCSNEGVTALEKSYKQEYCHQSEGTSPGKPLDLEWFARCRYGQGLPVPAACRNPAASPSVCKAGLTLPVSCAISVLWLRLLAWKTLTQSYSNCSFAPS